MNDAVPVSLVTGPHFTFFFSKPASLGFYTFGSIRGKLLAFPLLRLLANQHGYHPEKHAFVIYTFPGSKVPARFPCPTGIFINFLCPSFLRTSIPAALWDMQLTLKTLIS
jgi:hypothetical protein